MLNYAVQDASLLKEFASERRSMGSRESRASRGRGSASDEEARARESRRETLTLADARLLPQPAKAGQRASISYNQAPT